MSLLSRGGPAFGRYDRFEPETEPDPSPFLDGHDILTGRRHAAFHRLTRRLFEERGVYDMTFGYNLARLNLDERHADAGFRYAVETETGLSTDAETADRDGPLGAAVEERVLRAEFTPTTAFCPQSDTLTKGAFRAWNGRREAHEFDLVRVRVVPSHNASADINDELADLERRFASAGVLPEEGSDGGRGPMGTEAGFDEAAREGKTDEHDSVDRDAPF